MRKGFTLIELLVVIGILAILLAITLIAINPAHQFGQARDTQRRSDVLQILNAVHQYAAEHNGNLPTEITTTDTEIANDGVDLCSVITTTYMPALPRDPSITGGQITNCSSPYDTGYMIVIDSAGRVTVSAPDTDNGPVITVTR